MFDIKFVKFRQLNTMFILLPQNLEPFLWQKYAHLDWIIF